MMKRLKNIVTAIIIMSASALASSLLLTGTENWKLYLAVFVLAVSLKAGFIDD